MRKIIIPILLVLFSLTSVLADCDYNISSCMEWIPETYLNGTVCLTTDLSCVDNSIYLYGGSNYVFDCHGYNLQVSGDTNFYAEFENNVTYKNCRLEDTQGDGFVVYDSTNIIINNIYSRNVWGQGMEIGDLINFTIKNSISKDNNEYGIRMYTSTNGYVENFTATGNTNVTYGSAGIYLRYTNNCTFVNVNASYNSYGIILLDNPPSYINQITIKDSFVDGNNYEGIKIYGFNHTIDNVTALNNGLYGINISSPPSTPQNITIKNSKLHGGNNSIYFSLGANGNWVYNNLLNNTINVTNATESMNTTRQLGSKIYGSGSYIGGNYWTNSTGNGYSDTCTPDVDGFCDTPLTILGGVVDYLPLAEEPTPTTTSTSTTTSSTTTTTTPVTTTVISQPSGLGQILSEVGEGMGSLMSAIRSPLATFLLALGMVGFVMFVIYALFKGLGQGINSGNVA